MKAESLLIAIPQHDAIKRRGLPSLWVFTSPNATPRFRFQISNPSGNLLTDLSFTEPFPSPIFDLCKMFTSRVMVKLIVMRIIVTVSVPRSSIRDSRSSILENLEDRGSSRVSSRSRAFAKFARQFLILSSGENKGVFS